MTLQGLGFTPCSGRVPSPACAAEHFSIHLNCKPLLNVLFLLLSVCSSHFKVWLSWKLIVPCRSWWWLHHTMASWSDPFAKTNFLRCQRGLCCCIHWGQGGTIECGGAHPLSSSLLASLFLRPQVVFSKESPTQRKTVSLHRTQDITLWCICVVWHQRTHFYLWLWHLQSPDFLQVIK